MNSREESTKIRTFASKGDTLPALIVWFHHTLVGFSSSTNDFCSFLIVITLIKMAHTHCKKMNKLFLTIIHHSDYSAGIHIYSTCMGCIQRGTYDNVLSTARHPVEVLEHNVRHVE
jgi:hypothetical protein